MPESQIKVPLINICFSFPEALEHVLFFSLVRTLFLATSGIFIPIYILNFFQSFSLMIFYFFLQYGLFYIISIFFLKWIVEHRSIELAQSLSLIFMIGQLIILDFLKNPFLIIVLAFFGAFSESFYWLPKHLVLGLFGQRRKVTQQWAFIETLNVIVSIIGPVLSAFFIKVFGYHNFFFIFSIVIILIALGGVKFFKKYCLFPDRHFRPRKEKLDFSLLFSLEGLWNAFYAIAGILIFILTKDVLAFGGLTSLMAFSAVFINLLISKRIDQKHDYALGSLGYLIRANIFTLIFLAMEPKAVALAMILFGITSPLVDPSFYGFFYNLVKKYGAGIVYHRALLLSSFRTFGFLLFLFFPLQTVMGLAVLTTTALGLVYYHCSIKEMVNA